MIVRVGRDTGNASGRVSCSGLEGEAVGAMFELINDASGNRLQPLDC
jgi:hypothetical protein